MEKKVRIYIASPYTIGDQAQNVKVQLDMFDKLRKLGLIPFAPLWSHFQHIVHPLSYDEWLEWDFRWLEMCDFVLRLPGESRGADMEVKHAEEKGITVFYGLDDLFNWLYKDVEPF